MDEQKHEGVSPGMNDFDLPVPISPRSTEPLVPGKIMKENVLT